MDKKSENKNDSNATEEKLNRLKGSIKGTLTRLETFTSEKTVSNDTNVTKIESVVADEESVDFPDAADVISNDIYMDGVLSEESTLKGSKKLQTKIRLLVSQLLLRGGFELNKWVSNIPVLLKDLSAPSYAFDKEFQDAPVKSLGMLWDPKVDCVTYKV
ncbi:integrase catalytic domain-containing protein [Trichonephila clavata]|uniref:Integrase catalytic domain-containing protein n=1 Tax=Trichonephila clavata TaxID=2740835 RepID=A0A8X6HYJ0_TRICU|nr:integrase catalytic domain-containing protein [Trichonephila clavata]